MNETLLSPSLLACQAGAYRALMALEFAAQNRVIVRDLDEASWSDVKAVRDDARVRRVRANEYIYDALRSAADECRAIEALTDSVECLAIARDLRARIMAVPS